MKNIKILYLLGSPSITKMAVYAGENSKIMLLNARILSNDEIKKRIIIV
jgi:hypothetical protein